MVTFDQKSNIQYSQYESTLFAPPTYNYSHTESSFSKWDTQRTTNALWAFCFIFLFFFFFSSFSQRSIICRHFQDRSCPNHFHFHSFRLIIVRVNKFDYKLRFKFIRLLIFCACFFFHISQKRRIAVLVTTDEFRRGLLE